MIDPEGSELLMEVFNRMTDRQKGKMPSVTALRIADFMVKNGYRFVFDKWYLQEAPDENARA
jgi:hypothetical protein